MALLRKLTFNNSVYKQILLVIIVAILVSFIGFMVGKFAWYLAH